jgi:hypothetical protein
LSVIPELLYTGLIYVGWTGTDILSIDFIGYRELKMMALKNTGQKSFKSQIHI